MKNFLPVIKEINRTLREIALFDTLLNSIIVFLAIYCLLSLFNLYPIVAAGIAAIYFFIKINKNFKRVKLIAVERRYPGLYEKLRTAADTLTVDNLIVNKLRQEVISKLRNVRVSSFLDTTSVSLKVILICLLFFFTIFITSLNLQFLNLNDTVSGIDFDFQFKKYVLSIFSGEEGDAEAVSDAEDTEISEDYKDLVSGDKDFEDIYGNISVAKLGNEKLNMLLNLQEDTVDFKNIKDIEEKSFNEFPPEEIVPTPAEYDEYVVPKEQQKLVKNYFEQISR